MRLNYPLILIVCFSQAALGQSNINNQIIQNSFQDLSEASGSRLYTGSGVPVFNHVEDTRGSRYLFDHWVHGSIVNMQGAAISNDSFFLNYDKISESLYLTMDWKTVVEISKKEVKGFHLKDGNQEFLFEREYLIDNKNLFQVLLRDSAHYSLFKLYHTRFRKADYTSDGIHESGRNYNEYIDQAEYFILFPDRQVINLNTISKKSIGKGFNLNPLHDKVVSYLTAHDKDPEDEQLLVNLVRYLNQ